MNIVVCVKQVIDTEAVIELDGEGALVLEGQTLVIDPYSEFAVERAVDGQEACERFAAASRGYYDAVLMDVQMPRMDGYEATRTIRSMDRPDGRQVPIVAMSANAFSDDVAASLASGMDEHLSKPIQIKTVVLTVLSLVQERRA